MTSPSCHGLASPPNNGAASYRVTSRPCSASRKARVMPRKPPPTIATLAFFLVEFMFVTWIAKSLIFLRLVLRPLRLPRRRTYRTHCTEVWLYSLPLCPRLDTTVDHTGKRIRSPARDC